MVLTKWSPWLTWVVFSNTLGPPVQGGTIHNGLGLPTSITKVLLLDAFRPIVWRCFLNKGFPFQLALVWIELLKNEIKQNNQKKPPFRHWVMNNVHGLKFLVCSDNICYFLCMSKTSSQTFSISPGCVTRLSTFSISCSVLTGYRYNEFLCNVQLSF